VHRALVISSKGWGWGLKTPKGDTPTPKIFLILEAQMKIKFPEQDQSVKIVISLLKYSALAFTTWIVSCSLLFEQSPDMGIGIAILAGWMTALMVVLFPYRHNGPGRLKILVDRTLYAHFALIMALVLGMIFTPRIAKPFGALVFEGIDGYRKTVKRLDGYKYAGSHCKITDQKNSDEYNSCWDQAFNSFMAKE
jgi:hypothetical protein